MENDNGLNIVKRKKKNIGIILLAIILLAAVAIGGFMLGINYANKDTVIDKDNSESEDDITNNGDNDAAKDITKEDIEEFLSPLVSGNPNYNLLLPADSDEYTDENIFSSIIQYLLANNKYTKSGDNYLFSQSDIKDVAKKYLIKDNFDYITTNNQFKYDTASKTFSSTLQFGVFGFDASVTKSLENYSVDGNKINANYKVTIAAIQPETGEISTGTTYSYAITLEKIDNELKITNVVNK